MYTVYRGGYNAKHPADFCMLRPNGIYCYLFLIIKSPARLEVAGEVFDVKSNTAVVIRPNVPYQYAATDGEYKNDWLYFDCTDEEFEGEYGELFHRPVPLQDVIQLAQYVKNIVWENSYADEKYRRQNVSALMQVLINKMYQAAQAAKRESEYTPYALGLQELRLTMQSRPEKNFTPEELAEKLKVSPSYFQFLYKSFFGVPFKTDLIQMRLEYARELIVETDLTLEQVAQICGYSNEIHFYRQFKAKMGMTPREYQASLGISGRRGKNSMYFG